MLTFEYTVREAKTGKKLKGIIEADNRGAASKLLAERGLAPLEIRQADLGVAGGALDRLKRIKTKDKILFSRQLSTLINAGLPLVQSLRNVGGHTKNEQFKTVISNIISDVEGGKSFSDALKRHPTVFDNVFVSLIAAGETSGTLDKALERLANQQEKDAEILSKVRGAMVYPLIVLVVMIAVVTFMIVKVLPQVQTLYAGISGAELPIFTKILLAISHAITGFWWIILLVGGAAGFTLNRWVKTPGGKAVADRFKMKAWPIGPLFMKLYMARFARTGTTLVASGVPLIQMLQITGDAIDNTHIKDSLDHAIEKVKGGKSLADALQGDPNFLELVPDMLRIGEQSGAIEEMMAKVADYYEKEVDNQIKTISTIIEPVMMIILGVFALIIVAAILLPIYGLAGKTIIK